MKTRIIYLLSLILLLAGRARAQEQPMPLSMQDAEEYALKHNANIRNSRVDVSIQEAANKEITSQALPQLNAKDDFNAYPNQIQSFVPAEFVGGPAGTYIAVPFTPRFSNTASASVSQIIFDGGVFVALKAKKTVMQLAELNARSTAQDVRYNIRKAYSTLVVSHRQLDLLNESVQVFEKTAADQQAMQKEGFIERVDIDRTTVTLNNLRSNIIRLRNILTLQEQMLKYTMGMDLNKPIVLTDTAMETHLEASRNRLMEEVNYSRRVEFNLVQTQIRLNEFDLRRYRNSKLPTLSAFGTGAYTYSSNKFKDVATPSNYLFYSVIGATLNIPIFSGFRRNSQIRQAELRLEKSKNTLDYTKQSIDLQYGQARTTLTNALSTFENEKDNLTLANKVLSIATTKYKEGVGSSVEVNQAQMSMLESQNNYFNALLDIINAETDLQKALGDFAN